MTKKTVTPPAVPTAPVIPSAPVIPVTETAPVIPVTETAPVIVATPELMTASVAPLSAAETVTPPAVPELQESFPDDLEDGQLRVRHKISRQVFVVAQDYYDIHQGVLELVE